MSNKGYSLNEIKLILKTDIEEKFSSIVGNDENGVYNFGFYITNYNGEQWKVDYKPKEEV